MATRVGINGFGRIGRQSLKALIERAPDVEVVAVNDLVDAEMNALLFKHDSTYGAYAGRRPGRRRARSSSTAARSRSSPSRTRPHLPWGDLGVDIVLESHRHLHRRRRRPRRTSTPAPRRSSSAPRPRTRTSRSSSASTRTATTRRPTTSSATPSCTTNCLAPAAKVVHDLLDIERGLMNTIHSYTNDQRILDVAHKDPRRARSAGQNIIPTTTGAAKALALVIPDLKGKFDGFSLRVPTPTVSVVDFTATVSRADHGRGAQRRVPRRRRRPAQGHPRRLGRAARVDGLQGRQPLARSSTPTRPWSSAGTWSRSSPGTTTSGATAAASPTSSRSSRRACRVAGLTARRRPPRPTDGQAHDPRRRRRRQARLRPRRLQRPARRRQGHRRLAHPGRDPDHRVAAQRRARGSSSPATSAGPNGKVQDGLRLRPVGAAPDRAAAAATCRSPATRSGIGTEDARQAAPAGRGPPAREPPLPRRGGGERPGLRRGARLVRRRLRQRRVRDGAPGARLDGRHRQAPAGLRRAADGARDRDALEAARGAGAPVRGDPRRRQGLATRSRSSTTC